MNQNSMETVLQAIVRGQRPYPDFSVQYDDVHGLWGGNWLHVSGEGQYEHRHHERGAPEATVTRSTIPASDIRALVRLLLELEAWQQQTPERAPLPDESRATLTIQVGEIRTIIWEWYNELGRNGRLLRIRESMLEPGKPFKI